MTAQETTSEPRRAFDRWTVLLSAGLLLVLLGVGLYLRDQFPVLEAEGSLASNVGFFLLINLNIVVVMILGFLVVKNIIKLVLDRRRNILGSKLRTRLVVAFVGLSLIPTVLLFTVAKGILERVLQGWFSPQVAASVEGSLSVARLHYEGSESQLYRQMTFLSEKLSAMSPLLHSATGVKQDFEDPQFLGAIEGYLEEKRKEYGLFDLALLDEAGRVLARASSHAAKREVVVNPSPNFAAVYRSLHEEILVQPEQSLNGEFMRGYAPIAVASSRGFGGEDPLEHEVVANRYSLVGTVWVAPEISKTLAGVINAHDDYNELRTYRRPLASSYFLTLVVVTLLIIFAAVWVGFYLARGVSVPIGLIAEGTQQVAHGNLEYRIPEIGDDELSVLVRSFNTMTLDLRDTTDELESRRRYMETVLARVGVGVISLNPQGSIMTCNMAAGEILGIQKPEKVLQKPYREVFPEALREQTEEMVRRLFARSGNIASAQLSLTVQASPKHLQLTCTKLVGEAGAQLGVVMLLDDITELISAQRMSAWREVARRIAHEIKNPLTPIQLSAQRMQRKFGTSGDSLLPIQIVKESDRALIQESTEIIVRQVEMLRSLVNEFSRFARMPKVHLQLNDLGTVIEETVRFFKDAHRQIEFCAEIDPAVPRFPLDGEQMNRALVNLIDNSVASVQSEQKQHAEGKYRGKIVVEAHYQESLSMVSLVVADNGQGITPEDKPRLFEPYFSTKHSGTGLGLAIVNTIVADHNGYIRVTDNHPRGARFTIELPVTQEVMRKRA